MFHTPAHKFAGPTPPAQLVFRSYTDSGRPRPEVPYAPLGMVIGGRRVDLALHQLPEAGGRWRVSDPQTGRRIVDLVLTDRQVAYGDVRQYAATSVREHAIAVGEQEFFERVEVDRRRTEELRRRTRKEPA